MAKDDYMRIIYVILKELYETKKDGEKVSVDAIGPSRFHINEGYWMDIMCDMLDKGLIRGFLYRQTKTGRTVTSMEDIAIIGEENGR